jgi:hypothetical protein
MPTPKDLSLCGKAIFSLCNVADIRFLCEGKEGREELATTSDILCIA